MSRSILREKKRQHNMVLQMPWEEMILRRQWSTVSKTLDFMKKRLCVNMLVILFIHHFSPSLCPCELSPVDFIMGTLCSLASKWAWPVEGNGRSEGRRRQDISPIPSVFWHLVLGGRCIQPWLQFPPGVLFSLVLVLTVLVPSLSLRS